MNYYGIMKQAHYNYEEYKAFRFNKEPRYAVMSEDTELILIRNMEDYFVPCVGDKFKKRIFGCRISICDELPDGVIEFVG